MKIGYYQLQPIRANPSRTLSDVLSKLDSIEADLLVFPELAFTGYLLKKEEIVKLAELPGEGIVFEKLMELASNKRMIIIYGFPEKTVEGIYNSALILLPDGNFEVYRKLHLFEREKELFLRGNKNPPVVEFMGVKIGTIICYDWAFPELSRSLALRGVHIIAHPSNLILPYAQRAMWTRAVENRVFTITANRIGTERIDEIELKFTGMSQIVSPEGEILVSSDNNSEEVRVVEIDPSLAENKNIANKTNLFEDRRPEFYDPLCS